MKISNGTILEMILAIFFLLIGFNIKDSFTSFIVILISIIVIVHTLYIFLIRRKKVHIAYNKDSKNNKNAKVIVILPLILLLFNIVLLIFVGNNYYKSVKKQEDFKKCIKKVKYRNNFIIDLNTNIEDTEYILTEKEFKKLEQCYNKLKIKINK